ncbi:hypothetical protein BDV96DRAFT_664124 [Lophiotrema nucula]|uniref:DUF7605 domain-containing protein n=1 Tax=Lophiotrema nucula TaxID=690887 RepID=A0A6A5Z0G5_9PLEO|nr:hypothetical protein BDV96DRAFT_664124 [Lophiotrema nucula]
MSVKTEAPETSDTTSFTIEDHGFTFENFAEHFKAKKIVPRYDSMKEAKLPHDWWKLDQERIHKLLKAISTTSTAVMVGIGDDDAEVHHLHKTGAGLYKVKRSKTFQVAMSGPQASGKSSFLNALLDCPGLCLSGSDGQACTNAVVRYVHYSGTGDSVVMAEIKFHDLKKIEVIIQELAKDFYHFHHFEDEAAGAEEEEESIKKRIRTHDEADVQAKDTAQDIFETLYGSKDEFFRVWSPDAYETGEFQRNTVRKCQEAIQKLDINKEMITFYFAKTPAELSSRIKAFLTKVDGEMALWPLVDSIKYGIDRDILKQGYEFIDLPGWGDRNIAKSRHADEIKDTVDMEMIFIDTSRITTENTAINKVREAIHNRGANGVIIIATKVDSMTEDELSNCRGPGFDEINAQLEWADAKIIQAIEDGDDDEQRDLGHYQTYLKRERKSLRVSQRRQKIDHQFEGKFEDLCGTEQVKVFHVSSAEYLKWISRPKIPFALQADLSPEMTGLPELRKHLYHLPVSYNFRDLRTQVFSEVNSYLDQIDRVINQKDRSEGFKILAKEFVEHHETLIKHLKQGVEELLVRFEEILTTRNTPVNAYYRQRIEDLVERWYGLNHGPFNKILKAKGYLPAMASKAKGLENGCNWNKELSNEFVGIFKAWKQGQNQLNETLQTALSDFLRKFYGDVIWMMEHSKSDVSAIATARKNWIPYKNKMLNQIEDLINDLKEKQSQLLRRGTMSDDRQNSLVPTLMESFYHEVYSAVPPKPAPSPDGKRRRAMGKYKYQKQQMSEILLSKNNHIFDEVLDRFAIGAGKGVGQLLENHIGRIDNTLQGFSQKLYDLLPDPYDPTPQGENIRAGLRTMLPELRNQAVELQRLLPPESDEFDEDEFEILSATMDPSYASRDFTYFIDRIPGARPRFHMHIAMPKKKVVEKTKVKDEDDEDLFLLEAHSFKKRRT